MFKSIKSLLIAVTAIVVLSAPSVACAYTRVDSGGPSTSAHSVAPERLSVAQVRGLDQLQASVAQRFASEGGWPSTASRDSVASAVHPARPSSQAGFQWGDAGIGGAGVLALVGIGAGATVVIRRRVREPLAN